AVKSSFDRDAIRLVADNAFSGKCTHNAQRQIPCAPRNCDKMLDNLTERLSRVVKTLRGEARLTDANIQDALREVRLALLEADVALPVVKDFIAAIRDKAQGEEVVGSLTPGQALIGVVARELTVLMGG